MTPTSLLPEGTDAPCLPRTDFPDNAPIRAELCGPEHLERMARDLASAAVVVAGSSGVPLLRQLQRDGRTITRAYRSLAFGSDADPLTPEGEWLIDNYYVIEESLREVRTDLPRGYSAELPVLASGPLSGLPRVYELAVALLAHTDSALEESEIRRFVGAYQEAAPLMIGELWAVPAMLRLALLDNLARLADRVLRVRADRLAGAGWVAARSDGRRAAEALPADCGDNFVVGVLHALRDRGAASAGAAARLREWLGREGLTASELLRRVHGEQAADQVSIGNCVTSLRLLNVLDWKTFFESLSAVETVLREDPSGAYARQEFAARDASRRAVERLARGSGRSEVEVARAAVERARRAESLDSQPRAADHVGYHLLDAGRDAFERALGYHAPLSERPRRFLLRHPGAFYFGGIVALTAVASAVAAWAGYAASGGAAWLGALAALAVLLPASELAVALVNYLVCRTVPPQALCKLDFKDGIPDDCATFVVVPTLLTRPESAAGLLERLELHYLGNTDPRLSFALLTDFTDAPSEQMPTDDACVRAALDGVKALNAKYAAGGPDRFFLFHRRRVWDESEGCWMGWERKRGKLQEFNRLVRGDAGTTYSVCSCDPDAIPRVRFVVTLDTDTVLPRDAARRLIGTLAHPLNQPVLGDDGRRVVAGHGVLQPRVSFLPRSGQQSLFARIFAGSAGIDPYSSAASDVYQDLFGRGTYTGKGAYDVDAFEAVTGPAFPDNHILSHDLIEGNFARCGLVSDVEVFDDFPPRYHAYARREHRWARGDWQLLPWLGRSVPIVDSPSFRGPAVGSSQTQEPPHPPPLVPASGERGAREVVRAPNVLPTLERWKVIDNLRRSLVPPALLALLVLGWTVLPGPAWAWTLAALAVPALPLTLLLLDSALSVLTGAPVRTAVRHAGAGLTATVGQATLSIVFLAHQARILLDAVARTLWRLFVTRRHMLEWETAAAAEQRLGDACVRFLLTMWPASALAVALAGLLAWLAPASLPAAAPLLVAWLVSPLVAWAVSRPFAPRTPPLDDDGRRSLRRLARKTWAFFERFVGPEDHWLPPDNFQEEPKGEVAHRTSPTNKGLLLIGTLAAHDLGYLTLVGLAERLRNTFDTLDRLEKYRGHFLNWYDTLTLRPLSPPYVSTVDSGNLLGCLLALAQGLRQKLKEPVPSRSAVEGLADALTLARGETATLPPAPADLPGWHAWLAEVEKLGAAHEGNGEADPQRAVWAGKFRDEVQAWQRELDAVCPWAAVVADAWNAAADLPAESRAAWGDFCDRLARPAGVAAWAERLPKVREELAAWRDQWPENRRDPVARLAEAVERSAAAALVQALTGLIARAEAMAKAMDFRFLYNSERDLFAIGYNHQIDRLDAAHYDLLASEACLASFLTVARGEVPRRHWFQLGRPFCDVAGRQGLLSWGGTMFEYLMPRLLLPETPGTLLDSARRAAVARQIEYGRENGVPWGISESAYNLLDASQDYQYQSFGVPGLGLKRGLNQDLVIAPYATALALAVEPVAAVANFRRLRDEGAEGPYGFYEAIDYTPKRRGPSQLRQVIRSYMAHHQGMALVAATNRLLDDIMPRRLAAVPIVRAAELMLQERPPLDPPVVEPHAADETVPPAEVSVGAAVNRRLTTADTPAPRVHLLSNGRYTVLVTNAGTGSSHWRGLDVTRWRADRTADPWGQFCYVRDLEKGRYWSAGHQPVGRPTRSYEVVFSTDKAEFRRLDERVETRLEVTVPPDKDVEVRRVTLFNHDLRPRELELTSYAEVALLWHGADAAHPAFGKLFVETEWLPEHGAILCRRRPRSAAEKPLWAVHVVTTPPGGGRVTCETDRARFIGRRRTLASPGALDAGVRGLSGVTGAVLDPVVSLRVRLRLAAEASASVAFTTGVAETREEAVALADQFHTTHAVTRAFELAWAHSRVELRHLRLDAEDAQRYQRLAGHLLFPGRLLRAPASVIESNHQGQPALWRHGISGDLPILLVRVSVPDDLPLAAEALAAHAFWRTRGLASDLVLLNESPTSYFEELQKRLVDMALPGDTGALADRPGGVFVRKADQMAAEDRVLLQAAAAVVLSGERGSLAHHLDGLERDPLPPRGRWTGQRERGERWVGGRGIGSGATRPDGLLFDNGRGGFTPDGREYVVGPAAPPLPWTNVVATPSFGFLVTDSGGGYTWAGNSQTNRLTPWCNDPISDTPGEVVYVRDEDTGEVWTPTPLPAGRAQTVVRHGQGYSVFEQPLPELDQELTLFAATEAPVKVLRFRVRNRSGSRRRLSVTFYAEWVLGTTREREGHHIVTSRDDAAHAVLARNAFNPDFGHRVAFAASAARPQGLTADRVEFLGRNGRLESPAALERVGLSGRTGAALDPCAALQVRLDLAPNEQREAVFLLGQAGGAAEVRHIVWRFRDPASVEAALKDAASQWDAVLSAVRVQTPEPALDLLLNRWLLYQTLSCRVWGRSAFYQSGGAFGYRDQLQDVMALVHAAPDVTREHLLLAASRQFAEGDVQHWWHPPSGKGIRTRFSDDFLWLPLAVCRYVETTGDAGVLDEPATFLKGALLEPGQDEVYFQPTATTGPESLYEHCVRAVENGWKLGAHGLPLMGCGDWNDGMNRVGHEGRGESVWVAWFQMVILKQMAQLAESRGDADRARTWRDRIENLRKAVEQHAWDGSWYRRAYFDDGTPLGTAGAKECAIDSLTQSWAVLSKAADPERTQQAIAAAVRELVRWEDRLILLLAPPFGGGDLQPGYIKGYLPGVRENGGQYTHAAIWLVQALAELGRGGDAHALFNLLNPVRHGDTPSAVERYRVEPYVVAADVYGVAPHVGRGGWTWYTGSASWLYRVGLESLLGFRRTGDRLTFDPRLPSKWPGFSLEYRHGTAMYRVRVDNRAGVEQGVRRVTLDGRGVEGGTIPLADDGREHEVVVEMG